MRHRYMIIILVAIVFIGGVWYVARPVEPSSTPTTYGVSFAARYARELGLDPRQAYLALLDDVGVRHVRLSAYWDEIEPASGVYDFADLDWEMDQAASHKAKVVLAVGRKLPRWPECFAPAWVIAGSVQEQHAALLTMIRSVVGRYKDHPALEVWQVENEPFLSWFGENCPAPDSELLNEEIATVRALSDKPIMITDSGELSTWYRASRTADLFGTTLYQYTWNGVFGHSFLPLPAASYRFKARFNGFDPSKMWIAELQAEPWGPGKHLTQTPLEEQLGIFSLPRFEHNLALAKNTGAQHIYFWGGEWWYWMKETQGHREYWDAAKKVFQ